MAEIREHDNATHLELCQREAAPETHAVPVDEGEQMAVPLDLLRLLREPVFVEPALGAELARVGAPERDSGVHATDGHCDFLTLGDGDVVGELARWEAQWRRERNDVILRGLLRLKESV